MSIPVIPLAEAVAALEEGQTICRIIPKAPGKDGKIKTYQAGTVYFDLKYTINVKHPDGRVEKKECGGDFSYTDVKTCRPPVNKDDPEDERNHRTEAGKEPSYQIQTDTKNGAMLARFCVLFDAQLERLVQEAASGPNKIQGFNTKDRKYHHLIQTHIQDEQSENYGEALDNPIVRLKLKTGTYSEKFSRALAGKPQSEFLDGNTKRVVANRYVYDPCYCLGEDGEPILDEEGKKIPVTVQTLYHYLISGSKIEGRININSIAINKMWVSPQMTAPRTIIWRGTPGGAVYEDEIASDNAPADNAAPTVAEPTTSAEKVAAFVNDLDKAEDDLE